jgi:predicted DNA binding CopG/RHH family protein
MKAVQYFSDDYLEQCRELSAEQIIRYLDDFRCLLAAQPKPSKLISIKVPEDLLNAFKAKSRLAGTPYQTQIKALMKAWLLGQDVPRLE